MPVLILLGAGAHASQLLDTAGMRGLNDLTFYLAIPALLFGAVVEAPEAGLATILKLVVLPVLVWGLAHLAGLGAMPAAVAVLAAGMPTGANAFFLARRTGAMAAASAGTVVVSTALSVLTLSAILAPLR